MTDPTRLTAEPVDTAKLRHMLGVLCRAVWDHRLPEGEHLWTIPADPKRDFDCLFSDALDEIDALRTELAQAQQSVQAARNGVRDQIVMREKAEAKLAQVEQERDRLLTSIRFKGVRVFYGQPEHPEATLTFLLNRLAVIAACSSPDGSAELDQVEMTYAELAALKARLTADNLRKVVLGMPLDMNQVPQYLAQRLTDPNV